MCCALLICTHLVAAASCVNYTTQSVTTNERGVLSRPSAGKVTPGLRALIKYPISTPSLLALEAAVCDLFADLQGKVALCIQHWDSGGWTLL